MMQRRDSRRTRERLWRAAMACVGIAWTVSLFCLLAGQSSSGSQSLLNASTALSCNSTSRILIIRHCDKDDTSRRHCNAKGFRRAEWFPSLFVGPDARYEPPYKIIARGPERKHYVMRSVEMVKPLSEEVGVEVFSNYSDKHVQVLIDDVRSMVDSGELCDKLLLVCWKHEQIPHIAEKLGYYPANSGNHKKSSGKWKWKGKDFDTIVDLNITILGRRKKKHKRRKNRWLVQGHLESENFVEEAPPA